METNNGVSADLPVLQNETVVNVAGLLRELVGSKRTYRLAMDRLSLAENVTATAIAGELRLTRLTRGLLADVAARAMVELECVRCLQPYAQPVETNFSEEFRQIFDLRSGSPLLQEDGTEGDEEEFEISAAHEIDFAEALRQHLVLALPMRPDCGAACPGPDMIAGARDVTAEIGTADKRFAALAALLDETS